MSNRTFIHPISGHALIIDYIGSFTGAIFLGPAFFLLRGAARTAAAQVLMIWGVLHALQIIYPENLFPDSDYVARLASVTAIWILFALSAADLICRELKISGWREDKAPISLPLPEASPNTPRG